MTEHEEYCVSIRDSYKMPDRTPAGYAVMLWAWNSHDETWRYAAIRNYLFADYEDVSTRQPLPKLECEDTILAVLTSEDVK